MIKPEQVSKEAAEAAAVQISNGRTIAHAIAAALNAWPGAYKSDPALFGHKLILPLPQEGGDE